MVMTFGSKRKSLHLHGHAAGTVKQCTPANRTNIPVGGAFPPITLENNTVLYQSAELSSVTFTALKYIRRS